MLTKTDIAIALMISTGIFVVSIGLMGIREWYMSIIFFLIPLVITLSLFSIFKPKNSKPEYNKGCDY